MNFGARLRRWAEDELQRQQELNRPAPRSMTESEISATLKEGWTDAPKSIDKIRQQIQRDNPVRWARLQREFRWAQKRMRKLGLNPDDVRWIL